MRLDIEAELARRMARPQRHRLLQGYPMLPLMTRVDPDESLDHAPFEDDRPLIVGVLPHPFCNPRVRGCGFCTFPHETFKSSAAKAVVDSVIAEVRAFCDRRPWVAKRAVAGVYFGGGTANLTPSVSFERLGAVLASRFDLSRAEVTLEGVPIYFLTRPELLDTLESLGARQARLSLGVQTFDRKQLAAMGRTAFGTRDEIARVVAIAHARGMTTSCDLLCNLPDQSLEQMSEDVHAAIEIGFDQVCLYQLVLDEGLDVPWASDPLVLAALPPIEAAYHNWSKLREVILESGFVQSTLTNFERASVASSERRFVYEACSFAPETFDGLGFGPGAISLFSSTSGERALKWVNAASSADYRAAIARHGQAPARSFEFELFDVKLLNVTRKLPLLEVPREPYRARFGSDVVADFAGEWAALEGAALVSEERDRVTLTPLGMFYADSVAGLLAWRRTRAIRDDLAAIRSPMG